jgi:hypothetical protein
MRKLLFAAALIAPAAAHAQAYTQIEADLGYSSYTQQWYSSGIATVQGWSTLAACQSAATNQAADEVPFWTAYGNGYGYSVVEQKYSLCVPSPTSINTAGAVLHYRLFDYAEGTLISFNAPIDTAAHCTTALTNWQALVAPVAGSGGPKAIEAACVHP